MIEIPRVFCFTSDKSLWALKVFSYLYQKYWGDTIGFVGYSVPDFELPGAFYSMGNFADYPAEKWSNGVLHFLKEIPDEYFIFMLEDYWISREVNREAISELYKYAKAHPDIARVDITSDRLYGANLVEVEPFGKLDIIENVPAAPYHLSLQAGIWKKSAFLKYVLPNESAWQVEVAGSNRMVYDKARVIGTRQFPLRYLIGIQQGKVCLDGGYQQPCPKFKPEDMRYMQNECSKHS